MLDLGGSTGFSGCSPDAAVAASGSPATVAGKLTGAESEGGNAIWTDFPRGSRNSKPFFPIRPASCRIGRFLCATLGFWGFFDWPSIPTIDGCFVTVGPVGSFRECSPTRRTPAVTGIEENPPENPRSGTGGDWAFPAAKSAGGGRVVVVGTSGSFWNGWGRPPLRVEGGGRRSAAWAASSSA